MRVTAPPSIGLSKIADHIIEWQQDREEDHAEHASQKENGNRLKRVDHYLDRSFDLTVIIAEPPDGPLPIGLQGAGCPKHHLSTS